MVVLINKTNHAKADNMPIVKLMQVIKALRAGISDGFLYVHQTYWKGNFRPSFFWRGDASKVVFFDIPAVLYFIIDK